MRWTPLLPLTLWLTACGPSVQVTEQPLPVEIPGAYVASAAGGPAVASEWWKAFGDTKLNALVEEALARNHDLAAAARNVDQYRALMRIAGADLYPHLGVNGTAARGQEQTALGNFTASSFKGGLAVSWELDVWGRVRAGRKAAADECLAAVTDLAGARLSLAAAVTRAWFGITQKRQALMLAKQTAQNYERTLQIAERRYQRGVGMSAEVRLARGNLAGARAKVRQQEAAHQAAVRALEVLLGRYPAGELQAKAELPALPEPVDPGLPSALLFRRPDLVAAWQRLNAADARIREAHAALFPQISLTASGGRTSGELEDLLHGSASIWALAGNLMAPIFQGGRLRGNLQLQEARAEASLQRYVQSVLDAFHEVETQLANEVLLRHQIKHLRTSVAEAKAAEQEVRDQYRNGLADVALLLNAERQSFAAQSALIAAEGLLLDNRVGIYLALGGGFENAFVDKPLLLTCQ